MKIDDEQLQIIKEAIVKILNSGEHIEVGGISECNILLKVGTNQINISAVRDYLDFIVIVEEDE